MKGRQAGAPADFKAEAIPILISLGAEQPLNLCLWAN